MEPRKVSMVPGLAVLGLLVTALAGWGLALGAIQAHSLSACAAGLAVAAASFGVIVLAVFRRG